MSKKMVSRDIAFVEVSVKNKTSGTITETIVTFKDQDQSEAKARLRDILSSPDNELRSVKVKTKRFFMMYDGSHIETEEEEFIDLVDKK